MKRKHRHFEIVTPNGNTAMVNGDPNMPQETADALAKMVDLLVEQFDTLAEQKKSSAGDPPAANGAA